MESQYKGPERRKSTRVTTNFPVLYDIDPQVKVRLTIKQNIFSAIAKNICEVGMAILTNIDLPLAVLAHVDFTLCNTKEADLSKRVRRIEVGCRTRYSFSATDGVYKVGLQFLDLPEEDRRFIAKYIKDFTGRTVTN